jgi:hypothetical protein
MAKRKQFRDQQARHEDTIVQELLAELQAIAERRQYAVQFHQLMQQRCHREIPVAACKHYDAGLQIWAMLGSR